jgi:single-stranded-DNA-specific exonuclease
MLSTVSPMSDASSKQLIIRTVPEVELNSTMDPVFRRIFASRGVTSADETSYQLSNLPGIDSIKNLEAAVVLLIKHIDQEGKLLIFGDYDADGATSTALCVRALSQLGHKNLSYLMPDRFVDGYGLSLSVAGRIATQKPDCVITVDNGIASIDGIDYLRQKGIDVIVTDHHLAADKLPDANVIVNQNAWSDEQRGKNLAGVGVAFYLMLALRKALRDGGWFNDNRPEPNLASCLDLVALGTLADLVPLDYSNRILINEGLRRIRAGSCCSGIRALIEISNKNLQNLTSTDISFAIAPKINAAGRLDDMTVGVQCLLADNQTAALELASVLYDINNQRRDIQQEMSDQAMQQMQKLSQQTIEVDSGIVLYQQDWHEGIVGIVAAKIREKYHRPSIVFAMAEDGLLKGSGRSIPGIHLRDILDIVDKRQPGVIVKFGGHAMAAGLSIEASTLEQFQQVFKQAISNTVDPAVFKQEVECDGSLEAQNFNLRFAEELQGLSPWGQRFPAPSFVGEFDVLSQRVLAEKHLKLQLALPHETDSISQPVDAIAFFQSDEVLKSSHHKIHIHYELTVNIFRQQKTLQLLIHDIL